ncbi:MAG: helix-turn-helix domain-containing protein [Gaiellaceae bacterium]
MGDAFEAFLQANFSERLMVATDPGTTFVLASELLDLKLTPIFAPTRMQEIFADQIFPNKAPTVYVIGDPTWDTTPSCDWFVVRQQVAPPRAELKVVEARPKPKSRAFKMFNELREWLNLTTQETATLVGVGRTTPLAWERDGREPQPAHARQLYQVHSIVGSLVKRLGADPAIEWLERGEPSLRERLERGEIAQVARDAERILLQRERRSTLPERDAIVMEDQPADGAAPTVVPLRAGRRRRSRRQGGVA